MTRIDLLSSGYSPSELNPLSPLDPLHKGAITAPSDTSSAADGVSPLSWKPSRPILTPPTFLPRSEYRLLATTQETRHLGDQILETLSVRSQGIRNKIKEISAENLQKLKEASERASTSGFWSMLKKIATCLLSAISVVFGVSMLASGGSGLIGGAMIGSGILSLANFSMAEIGVWDWIAERLANGNEEHKKKMAMLLPIAVGIVAGGIGLVGSVQGIASGSLQFAEKVASIAQSAFAVFAGITTFGKGVADAKLLWTQADLALIKGLLTLEHTHLESVIKGIESSMNDFNAITAKTKKTIQLISQSNTQQARA